MAKTKEAIRIDELETKLKEIADQLRRWPLESCWPLESLRGGWSTHQVGTMRKLADSIDEIIYK